MCDNHIIVTINHNYSFLSAFHLGIFVEHLWMKWDVRFALEKSNAEDGAFVENCWNPVRIDYTILCFCTCLGLPIKRERWGTLCTLSFRADCEHPKSWKTQQNSNDQSQGRWDKIKGAFGAALWVSRKACEEGSLLENTQESTPCHHNVGTPENELAVSLAAKRAQNITGA